MYVAKVPNRSSRPAFLLRESYRDGDKVKNRTLKNLSDWPPEQKETLLFDAGQAAAHMQLRAWELGVASCLGSVYEQEPARSLLCYPESLYLRIVIAFGYPRDTPPAPVRRGGRRALDDVVRWERW